MLWLAANRERIKAENPGIKVTDIAKKGGEVWKTLSADEKETFESQSKKDWVSFMALPEHDFACTREC
eukprot:m.616744 g.616744  ORF g.616744 m.616744 type:complete len:68 (+) comp58169_c0_seq4:175-378(+)